jgi:capsular polysaccharide biosynthesis protein
MDKEIKKVIQVIKSQFKEIVMISSLFVIVSIIYALLATQIFQARLIMVPNSDQVSIQGNISQLASQFGVTGLVGGGNSDFSFKNKEVSTTILLSRNFIDRFITEKNLMPILFEDKWDAQEQKWSVSENSIPKFGEAYRIFTEEIFNLSTDIRTGVITLDVRYHDRYLVADWANSIVKMVNDDIRERSIKESKARIRYLEEELKSTQINDLRVVLYKLIEEDIRDISIANSQENFAFKILDPARVPHKRVSPKRTQIVISSSIFGFFIALIFAFIREKKFVKRND